VGNLQAWARDLRYGAAIELAEELDEHARTPGQRQAIVAAGHTASDQVETILYRLAASPGRRALLGMRASEGRLVRPLLGVTREQTGEYCAARGLVWREDASNDNDAYARTRVRNELGPALRAVHPAAEANVLRTALLLREETELLDGLVDAELAGSGSIALARLRVEANVVTQPRTPTALHPKAQPALFRRNALFDNRGANARQRLIGHQHAFRGRGL